MPPRLRLTGDPLEALHAATKQYVDALVQGLDVKGSVRAATTANVTLSGTQTIDGVSLAAGDRVLVKNQSTTADNGVYVVASGAWARTTDADTWDELRAAFVWVEEGSTLADTGWVCTVNAGGTLGSTAVTWSQFSGVASTITVRKNSGSDVGTRPRLNLIEGTNVTLTVADDGAGNEIDITIAASGGGSPQEYDWRVGQHFKVPGLNAFSAFGLPTLSGSGSTASADDSDGPFITFSTTSSSGSTSRLSGTLAQDMRREWEPDVTFVVKTPATITDVRWWIGYFSALPDGSSDPSAHLAAFRYDTGTDGTAFWRTVTKDGTTINAQASSVAVAASTRYRLRIHMKASAVDFYIDGALVQSHTTNLPTASQAIGSHIGVTTLTAAIRELKYSRMWLRHRP